MLRFFRQPFPVNNPSLPKAILQSVLVGIFVAFVLLVFQPFGSYTWQHENKLFLLAGYSLVASITTFLNFYLFVKVLPSLFTEATWTVGKEIIWNIIPIFIGGFFSTVYGAFIGSMPFTLTQVSYMIAIVFLVGLFPSIIMVLLNYVYLIHKYRPQPYIHNEAVSNHITDPQEQGKVENLIELSGENTKDKLVIPESSLLFIEASDNYCTIFYEKDTKVNKVLLRSSLGRLETQLPSMKFVRCHRSFIVNLQRVKSVSGNAQGYKLHFEGTEFIVPVSRSYSSAMKQHLQFS